MNNSKETFQEKEITLIFKIQVPLCAILDQMVLDDDTDRAKFVRKLIRKEAEWRMNNTNFQVNGLPIKTILNGDGHK